MGKREKPTLEFKSISTGNDYLLSATQPEPITFCGISDLLGQHIPQAIF